MFSFVSQHTSMFCQQPVNKQSCVENCRNIELVAGSCSITLPRDDPFRLYLARSCESALNAYSGAKLASISSDYQFEVLMDFDNGSDAWGEMDRRQELKIKWFKQLVKKIHASLDAKVEKEVGYVSDMFNLTLRRHMPYNLVDGVDFAYYAHNRKPVGELRSLEAAVVSHLSCICVAASIVVYNILLPSSLTFLVQLRRNIMSYSLLGPGRYSPKVWVAF